MANKRRWPTHKKMILPILLLFIFTTTGCWNRRELNEIAIVTAAGIDKGEKPGEITVVYQIINPSAMSGGGTGGVGSSMSPFVTLKTSAPTEFAAVRKAAKELSRKLYFGHLQVWLISSELAEERGISKLIDFIYRDPEFREDIPVVITKGQNTEDVLSVQSILEKNNGISIKGYLENAYKVDACIKPVELREIVNNLTSSSRSVVASSVFVSPTSKGQDDLTKTQTSKQDAVIKVNGFAVFKQDKLLGYLNDVESRAYLFITNQIKTGILVVPFEKNKNSIEILQSNTKLKAEVKNGKPEVTLDITIDANVGEVESNINLMNLKSFYKLQENTNQRVKKIILDAIKEVQEEYKVDIFGFGEAFERQHPKEWKKMKKDWDQLFLDVKVNVKVDTTLHEVGKKSKPFFLEMKGEN